VLREFFRSMGDAWNAVLDAPASTWLDLLIVAGAIGLSTILAALILWARDSRQERRRDAAD
jgi:hypothetical protein